MTLIAAGSTRGPAVEADVATASRAPNGRATLTGILRPTSCTARGTSLTRHSDGPADIALDGPRSTLVAPRGNDAKTCSASGPPPSDCAPGAADLTRCATLAEAVLAALVAATGGAPRSTLAAPRGCVPSTCSASAASRSAAKTRAKCARGTGSVRRTLESDEGEAAKRARSKSGSMGRTGRGREGGDGTAES